jgi:O-antigen ligase
LPGFEVTLLEAVAALVLVALLLTGRHELPALLRARPLPLLAVSGYALVHLASALFAAENQPLAFKFAARMAVMAAFTWLVAALPESARRRALSAFVVSGAVVACLASAEGLGVRGLDGFLALFRETPFNVAGSRRATAGSEYPNQAAACLMYALVAWASLAQRARLAVIAGVSVLLSLGLLFTYSRGALAATLLALLASWLVARSGTGLARGPLVAMLALATSGAAFAASREVFRLRLASEGTEAWYGARYEPEDARLTLAPRESRRLRVRVTNTGKKAWTRQEAFHLSYHWYHPERRRLQDGGRTQLPADLEPGASVWLEPEVVAPDLPGRYRLVWDMVHEDTTWFSGQGVRPVVVAAVVGPAGSAEPLPADKAEPPPAALGWRPGRAELWRIAAAMWSAHPVLGVGPDNFRWLYGRFAAEPFWDTRVFANNTVLEAAATTGSFGAAALAITLAACLGASYRRFRSGPAPDRLAFLGLCVAILVHGLVDYLLAFTGHYLFFGFLIGGIAAAADRT